MASNLEVATVVRAKQNTLPILGIEVGDHIAYFSGAGGESRIQATTDGKSVRRRAVPDNTWGLRSSRLIGNTLWVTGESGTLAFSKDRAETWTTVDTDSGGCLWDIVEDRKGVLWVAGSESTLLKAAPGAKRKFKAVKHALKPRDERADPRVEIVPAGVMFTVFNALWDGKKFVKPKGLKGAVAALAIAPTGTIIIVGDNGAVFRSTDGGLAYKPVASGVKHHLNDVAIVAGEFVAAGDNGTLRHSDDDGLTWKPLPSDTKVQLWAIGSWGDGAFVGGVDGIVLRVGAPKDTYWKGRADDFAPKPIVRANVKPLARPSQAKRDARFAELFAEAEAAHAQLAKKCAQPRVAMTEHATSILAALDNIDEYRVYGDALQAAEDPRGELVALQISDRTKAEAKAYLKKHAVTLLGKLAELVKVKAIPSNALDWRWGFIHAARIAASDDNLDDEDAETSAVPGYITTLLDEPAAQFLQKLVVGIVTFTDNAYDEVIREIGRRARPALRDLELGDYTMEDTEVSWTNIGDVSKLCGAVGNLQRLKVRGGSMKLGDLVFPRLRTLEIETGGLTRASLKAIETASMPSLETLSLFFGTADYGCNIELAHLQPLLRSDRFPRLRRLGLRNSELADQLCGVLHTSSLVASVIELDLSSGTLSDRGAAQLATYAGGLAHLEILDVSDSYLSKRAIKLLEDSFPEAEVVASKQRLRPGEDEFSDRYVSLGE